MFAASLGGMTSVTYSGFYGRRLIYLTGVPFLTLVSIGVALSRNVLEMMVWRFIQAFGTSGGMSVGAAVIGDIYKVTERGSAMGIFFGATTLGPALAPLAGGWGAHYAAWRWTQATLAFAGFAGFTFVGTAVLIANFALFVPIAYTIGAKYNITNEFIIGACFLPGGIGNIIGAPLAGRLSDRVVIASRRQYGIDSWRPEERLKAALVGALILVPLPVLLSGVITQYVDGKIGLVLNSYTVDIMHSRSAKVMAASTCSRAMIHSIAVAFVLPLIKLYGVAIADGIISLIGWSAFVLLWVAVRYGKEMSG
ncbi:MFS general substrate transporter [Armillaria nabsnona]|nr:MFS general substrate transporter [Armillaria nabsnona]